jgi:hypothetical protein
MSKTSDAIRGAWEKDAGFSPPRRPRHPARGRRPDPRATELPNGPNVDNLTLSGPFPNPIPAAHGERGLDARRSLPPAAGVAWRFVRGCTGRGGRGSPRSSGWSSSTSRSSYGCTRSASPSSTARSVPSSSACCAGSSRVAWSSTASHAFGAARVGPACSARFPAAAGASVRHAKRRSSSCGRSGYRRKCSSQSRIVTSSGGRRGARDRGQPSLTPDRHAIPSLDRHAGRP